MRRVGCLAFIAMHAACSSSATMPDAQSADASTGGLIVELVAKGGVPQMPTDGVVVERVSIGIQSLRAIGDAAPGDVRTTRTDLEFAWTETTIPIAHLFPMAPPGVYSTIELRVADSAKSSAALDILGRTVRSGDVVPFEIQSLTAQVSAGITVNTELSPRAIATTSIALDVAALVADIDWDEVKPTGEGRLFIGDGDPQMAGIVAALATAFSSAN